MATEPFAALTAINQLRTLMTMLRDGDFGCPWDLKQTIASLAPYTLEETYEVIDAIEKQDMVELEDELGDLLFQVIFYAQIASEEGAFDFDDVARAITRKLIRRHPHVFPDGDVDQFGQRPDISADQVLVNWEAIKAEERAEKRQKGGQSDESTPASVLDDVPRALPAMERARKLQKRAANHGFDWDNIQPVLAKLKEEIAEFEAAHASGDSAARESEFGDILFAAVNLARHCQIEPEIALRGTNSRFEARFKWIEAALHRQQRGLADADLAELDVLWEQAKEAGL